MSAARRPAAGLNMAWQLRTSTRRAARLPGVRACGSCRRAFSSDAPRVVRPYMAADAALKGAWGMFTMCGEYARFVEEQRDVLLALHDADVLAPASQ
jgi:hypothetical protein